MLGSSMGMALELHPDVWRGQEKFQMTNVTMPNNVSYMKYSLKLKQALKLCINTSPFGIFGKTEGYANSKFEIVAEKTSKK